MKSKQVIVIRKDLNMKKGKAIAQGAHASLKVFFDKISIQRKEHTNVTLASFPITSDYEADWINGSFTKIVVSVNSEKELLDIWAESKERGILCSLIQDEGRTEFNGVLTYTAVAIGPDNSDTIDKITKDLPLYK